MIDGALGAMPFGYCTLRAERCASFPRGQSADAARRAVKAIRESIKIIAQHPEIGRPVDHLEIEFREWLIAFGASGYVVLYWYDGATAVLLAVRHQLEVGY